MNRWFFYILEGPQKGFKFPIKEDLTIGGDPSQINLKDPSVSKIHAEITKSNDRYFLIDKNSDHGVLLKNKKIKKIELHHKLQLRLGNSLLEVRDKEHMELSIESSVQKEGLATEETALPLKIEKYDHLKKIQDFCVQLSKKSSLPKKKIQPMNPPLSLHFRKGLQNQTIWQLGYGPRKAGSKVSDLCIFEKKAPGICFEIRPTEDGNLFKTGYPSEVLLNGKSSSSQILKEKDIITIYETEIEVGLMK